LKTKVRAFLQFIILLTIGITLLWLVFRHEDLSEIRNDIVSADYRWVGFSLVLSLLSYYIRAVRWKMLIEPMGFNPKLKNTFFAMMVGYMANFALPRLGEVSRCGALNRAEKIPFEKLFGTVIVERVIDVICLLCCLVIAAIIEYKRLVFFLHQHVLAPLKEKINNLLSSSSALIICCAFGIIIVSLLYAFRKRILALPIFKKIDSFLKGLVEGLRSVRKIKNNVLYVFLTIAMWTLYMLSSYVCFFSLDATKNLGLNAGVFTLVAGGFGMAAPVQGGIGAYHWAVATTLTMFDIDLEKGKTFATIVHGSQTIFAITLGFLSLILLYFSRRKADHANV
jgi:uncharacterized protein (TIRG00374 family)